MGRAEGKGHEERIGIPEGGMVGQHLDGLIGEHVIEVLTVLEGARTGRVVPIKLGQVLIGTAVQKAKETVETAGERPVMERPRRRDVVLGREMPFPDQIAAIAPVPQLRGNHRDVRVDPAARVVEPCIERGQKPHADAVVIAPGHQRRPRRGTQRGDVEVGVAQSPRRQPIDIRRVDR